jgi:uncharacterized protein (TIGR02145 family)
MKTKNWILICSLIFMGLVLGLTYSCKKDKPTVPVITTTAVTAISSTTAASGGVVTNDGGANVTVCGVCWSTGQTPTTGDSKTTDGIGTGNFSSTITGLSANTNYYVRAYATNSAGTAYGNEINFTTTGIVTDINGNVYNTVSIGTQVWMKENLKTTKFLNGDLIGTTTPATLDITNETTPEYQWAYDGNESNAATYGRLYTWYAIMDSRKVCPTGWHIPTDAEWETLILYLGGQNVAGIKLKETGATHWGSANNSTNESGFTALPGGDRSRVGVFYYLGNRTSWWSSTEFNTEEAWERYNNLDEYVGRSNLFKNYANSVRCIKDN